MAGFKATPITDNYHYGMLGEFKVIIHSDTNYLNITKLCTNGGREFRSWKRSNHDTLEFFDKNYLKNDPDNMHGHSSEYKCLYEIKNDNLPDVHDQEVQGLLQGTYCHMDVAVVVAVWISQEFKFKVSSIVRNYYHYALFLEKEQLKTENMSLTERLNSMEALIRGGTDEIRKQNLDLQSEVQAGRLENRVQSDTLNEKIDKLQRDVDNIYQLCCNKKSSNSGIALYREPDDDRSIIRIIGGTHAYIENKLKDMDTISIYYNISNPSMFKREAKDKGYLKSSNLVIQKMPKASDRKRLKQFLRAIDNRHIKETETEKESEVEFSSCIPADDE